MKKLIYLIILGILISCGSKNIDLQMEEIINTLITDSVVEMEVGDKDEVRKLSAEMLENPTTIEFEEPEHDFGEVSVGSAIDFSFKFKNTGESPLTIQSVKAACGCTILKDWPKEIIQPGESGEIPIVLNTNFPGEQKKYVSIIANTRPSITKVYMVGNVVDPKQTK